VEARQAAQRHSANVANQHDEPNEQASHGKTVQATQLAKDLVRAGGVPRSRVGAEPRLQLVAQPRGFALHHEEQDETDANHNHTKELNSVRPAHAHDDDNGDEERALQREQAAFEPSGLG